MGKSLDDMFKELNGKKLLLDFAKWADNYHSWHSKDKQP